MVSDSRFNMWRSVIAVAHADHKLTDEEVSFIREKIEKCGCDTDQTETLYEDLLKPASLADVLPKVTEPADRSMLVYYARLLAWADDEYAEAEEMLLNMMRDNALSQINLEQELNEAHAIAKRHADEYDVYLAENANIAKPKSWVGRSFAFFSDIIDRVS